MQTKLEVICELINQAAKCALTVQNNPPDVDSVIIPISEKVEAYFKDTILPNHPIMQDDSYWRLQFVHLSKQFDKFQADEKQERKELMREAFSSGSQRCNFFDNWYRETYETRSESKV